LPLPTIQRHGVPATPAELVQHRIVGGTAAAVPTAWRFERDGKEEDLPLEPHFSTNENEGAIAAAVAGFGITSTSGWACSRELKDGSLVRLFLGWKMVGIPVHAYFPMGSATLAAGRAAVDHLVAEFRSGADVLSPCSILLRQHASAHPCTGYITDSGKRWLPVPATENDLHLHQTADVKTSPHTTGRAWRNASPTSGHKPRSSRLKHRRKWQTRISDRARRPHVGPRPRPPVEATARKCYSVKLRRWFYLQSVPQLRIQPTLDGRLVWSHALR
jgi:hypothetical protein